MCVLIKSIVVKLHSIKCGFVQCSSKTVCKLLTFLDLGKKQQQKTTRTNGQCFDKQSPCYYKKDEPPPPSPHTLFFNLQALSICRWATFLCLYMFDTIEISVQFVSNPFLPWDQERNSRYVPDKYNVWVYWVLPWNITISWRRKLRSPSQRTRW